MRCHLVQIFAVEPYLTFYLKNCVHLDCTLGSMTNHTQAPTKGKSPQERAIQRLFDPQVLFLTLHEAAQLLGIAKSTAHKAVKETGQLLPGVPVQQVGNTRRFVVSTFHLRTHWGANSATAGINIENTFLP